MFAYSLKAYLRYVIQRRSFLLQPTSIKLRFSAGLFPAMSKQEGLYIECLPNI